MIDDTRRNVRLLNEIEAAERLGISRPTLAKLRKSGRIRYVAIGPKLVRYREEDLVAFYDESAIVDENSTEALSPSAVSFIGRSTRFPDKK